MRILQLFTSALAVASTTTETTETTTPEPDVMHELLPWSGDLPAPTLYKVRYQPGVLASLGLMVGKWVFNALKGDKDISLPLLDYDVEHMTRVTGEPLQIRLGRRIARQMHSVLYEVEGLEGTLIKYQTNCDHMTSRHPLMFDAGFQYYLSGTGISPRIHYMSAPVKFDYRRTPKTDFRAKGAERKKCADSPFSHIRYMIMDRVSISMADASAVEPFSVPETINVMRKLLSKLQALHQTGIVHADIHPGNVVFMDEARTDVGLIDFGRAFFVISRMHTTARIHERGAYVHPHLSIYELEGFRSAPRDDVFRAIMLGAYLLNPQGFTIYCQWLMLQGAEAMIQWKGEDFIFTIPEYPDPFAELTNEAEVKTLLTTVLTIVRNLDDIDRPVPYEVILEALDAAHRLVSS